MPSKSLVTTVVSLLLIAAQGPVSAMAAESVKHAGRNFTYLKTVEITEKDEASKHMAGTFQRVGLTQHIEGPRKGQISTITITGSFDLIDRIGPHQATILRSFDDGATVTVKIEGETKRTPEGRIGVGRYRCVEGTGSLEGVSCEGHYESRYFKNKMGVVDWQGTITAAGS